MMAGEKALGTAWETHGAGQGMLLRLRDAAQFATPRGRMMFQSTGSVVVVCA